MVHSISGKAQSEHSMSVRDFAYRALRNIWPGSRGSLRLDTRRLDHLGPLLGLVDDELAERAGTHRHRLAAELCQPHLNPGIGETGIDLLVEILDDLHWSAFRRAHAEPRARLVARHELSHGWKVRQGL